MKVVLSRKGFDASNGGCPSPIMPDGMLLSMPIPSDDRDSFDDLCYNGMPYSGILRQLAPRRTFGHCHVDPDIRGDCRAKPIPGWKPGFGQIGAARGVLTHGGVEPGDLFLFFGWFRKVELYRGSYRYVKRSQGGFFDHSDLHVIYGYMQVDEILTSKERVSEYPWHPHAAESRIDNGTNAIYIPTERLSFLPERKGYGTLDYRLDRVLTMENKNRGTWNELPFLMPEHVYGRRKNCAKDRGIYYGGIWQELVVYESDGLLDWVRGIMQ